MLKNVLRSCVAAIGLLAACIAQAAPQAPLPGVVRVKLQPEVAAALSSVPLQKAAKPGGLSVGIAPLDASLRQIKGVEFKRVFPCPPGREAAHAEFGLDCWYEVRFDSSVNPLEARRVMSSTPGVQMASERRPMKLYEGTYTAAPAPRAAQQKLPFNDPRLSQQWHYHNDGSMAGAVEGADINLFEAWTVATGSPNVIVAVIDGGIDYTHEDLADAMWVNEAELNGLDGVDDDGDGYIDNVYGFNFCTMKGDVYPHAHGTHVAGTIGAVNGNGIGVCGVAGGNGKPGTGVKLLSCQVFDSRSGVPEGDFAAAIIFAADMGATIANCSWGWGFEDYYEPDVLDAIRYFTRTARSNNMKGGLCIVATGNEGSTGAFYPGCMDEVVSVGAIGYDLTPLSYSNYGDWVDVSAPGGNVDFDQAQGVLSTMPGNTYGFSQGTSMAAPHVTGIAALILSKYGSASLINENLRQQLVTSVNDLYARFPEAKGNFGSGYIDAYKALQWGDGTPPAAVTDLSVIASQDNAQLSWTIPASSDNNVNSHIIYYLEEPFDADMLDECEIEVVDTKFLSSGDKFVYEVGNLSPLTTYYFAVAAVDRWGNSSPISDVVSATTNAGPKMTLSRTAMNMRTTDGSTWTSSTFDIGNTDEGLLRWKSYMRTLTSSISTYSAEPAALQTVPFKGRVGIQPFEAETQPVASIEGFEQEEFPQAISYVDRIYAFIGDLDATNSMAQLFTVDAEKYPDGFNLTHLFLLGTNGKNPTIEIYKNTGKLTSSTLLQTLNVVSENPYYNDIPLTESLWFAPGESFYVVAHFTEFNNRNYPLGLAVSTGEPASKQCYFSADLGKTWSLLPSVLKGTGYEEMSANATWGITAKSLFPDWSQIITLSPAEGQVAGGEKQTVTASHNGTRIPNGSYRARIHFQTNETNPTGKTINVNISVAGNKPEVAYNKVVKFGNVLVGQQRTITINVTNTGYGAFAGSANFAGLSDANISSTSPMFHGPKSVLTGIPARSTVQIEITYAPTEAGSHSGQVVFTDKDGNKLRINVQGAATDPAKIELNPSQVEVGDLEDGAATREVTFDITNAGRYPLQFVMPKFTDEVLDEVASGDTHRFGYTWESNLYGSTAVSYDGVPQLVDALDCKQDLGDYVYFSKPVDLGFEFPFYGKTYTQAYISSLGIITFKPYEEGLIYSPLNERRFDYLTGLGVISVYGSEFELAPSSHIEYAKQNGNFVVYFKNVLVPVYDKERIPASFHVVLCPNGDIIVSFDSYNREAVFEKGHNLWVGIADPDMEDPLTITSSVLSNPSYFFNEEAEQNNRWKHIGSGNTFYIHAPQPEMIRSIEPAFGVVSPGESVTVTASVAASEEMYVGSVQSNLVILSNDIVNPTSILRFSGNVTGDLRPELTLGADAIEFGDVFRTAVVKKSVSVKNTGRSDLTLQSVSLQNGVFVHDFKEPVVISAGQSQDILVTIPTVNEGEVADVMTVVTTAGEAAVAISGRVIGVPEAKLSYASVSETLASGDTKDIPLTIGNVGNEPLVYSVVPGNYINFNPDFETGSRTDYTYVASLDDPAAAREWVDINTNGLGEQHNYTYYIGHDFLEVDLPFEFPFYGKKYTKMYIYNAGFVSFSPRRDEAIWPEPPTEFPGGSIYDNLIAPYWGMHTMDITATAGTFHYVTDDQAVISYVEYGNSMNYGVNFQVILRKDGSFTFNYAAANAYSVIFAPFGLTGFCDGEGNGTKLPDRYIAFGNTINFYPVVESVLQPGEERVADLSLFADALAGKYKANITVNTNVPNKEITRIPVELTVIGEPEAVFPDDVVVEHVAGYRDMSDDQLLGQFGAVWYVPLEVKNLGTAAFTVESIEMTCPEVDGRNMFSLYWYGTYIDDWFGTETTGWSYYKGDKVVVGKSPLRMAIPITPSDFSYTAANIPGNYDITLKFNLSGLGELTSKEVKVKLVILEQPNLTIDSEGIVVEGASMDLITDRSFTISNVGGGSKLTYTLAVDPTGIGAEVPEIEEYSFKAPVKSVALQANPAAADLPEAVVESKPQPMAVGKSDFVYDCPEAEGGFEYNRALYHPALQSSTVAYNYGSTTTYGIYKAATAFVGPEGGFNISHIYSCMHPFGLSNTDVTFEIYNGDPQLSNDVLGRGTYHIGEVTSQQYENVRFIAALDRPVYINEGQQFYLVITYPAGQPYPSTLVVKEDAVVSNRYMAYWDSYGWFDVAELFQASYGSLGYLATCIETVEGDGWVKLLDAEGNVQSKLTGEVEVGAEQKVTVRLNAANAPKETDNRAIIVVRSNDPKASVVNFPVRLDKNARPVVEAASQAVVVAENSAVTVKFNVNDPDGDDISLTLADNGKMSKISSIELSNGEGEWQITDDSALSAVIKGATAGATVKVGIEPPFESQGDYALSLIASDAPYHESMATLPYSVAHTNRAPVVANPIEDMAVSEGKTTPVINLASVFSDPDGDELTYTFGYNRIGYLTRFDSGKNVIFLCNRQGKVKVTITATDPDGEKAQAVFTIDIQDPAGVDDPLAVNAEVALYPNPVVDHLNIANTIAGTTTVEIYSLAGAQVYSDTYENVVGVPYVADVTALPAGPYIVRVTARDGRQLRQVIVK